MTLNNTEIATFAAGCFWGTEHIFNKHFRDVGIKTRVGYMGGELVNPSYKQVKAGDTNHAEVCQILFDPEKVSFERLVNFFYSMHGKVWASLDCCCILADNLLSIHHAYLSILDPTTLNAQGSEDIGTQYRSTIFYHNDTQKAIAEKVTRFVQEKYLPNQPIVTTFEPATTFYDAEEYHQLYLENNPDGYTCPTHYLRW
ncbi:hypothetical protein BDF20DRAFT_838139 [Mycotypha africana]|uniref:uncharacterized protein n=1 Tax=Mycotypha africana TaxID=64632 RepID=UPI002300A01C|nr:uncharacterized protein BDF20DRAFT_838139 [Mycotypha africana]KAI8971861.1 hypothetical protein BDF20DRAFT_838139 [Mycotypha africana]